MDTNLGRVGFVLKGTWVAGAYKRLDVVSYDNATYGCIADTSLDPTNTSVWQKLVQDGTQGTNGSTWFSGSGVPSNGTGVNGDYYFRTDTDDIYLKAAGVYSIVANIQGLQGVQGVPGVPGVPGVTDPASLHALTLGIY